MADCVGILEPFSMVIDGFSSADEIVNEFRNSTHERNIALKLYTLLMHESMVITTVNELIGAKQVEHMSITIVKDG